MAAHREPWMTRGVEQGRAAAAADLLDLGVALAEEIDTVRESAGDLLRTAPRLATAGADAAALVAALRQALSHVDNDVLYARDAAVAGRHARALARVRVRPGALFLAYVLDKEFDVDRHAELLRVVRRTRRRALRLVGALRRLRLAALR